MKVLQTRQFSFELVRSLGAIPIDYAAPNATDLLIELAPFEVILDCVDSELAKWSDHVSILMNLFFF